MYDHSPPMHQYDPDLIPAQCDMCISRWLLALALPLGFSLSTEKPAFPILVR